MISSTLIDLKLKIKQNRWLFYLFVGFWIIGFIYYWIYESDQGFIDVILTSVLIREPVGMTDFNGFYRLLWPIMIEVIIFGFFVHALLEKYNPVETCRILARAQTNHTVVIGFYHLGERIVDYLIENKKAFALIEKDGTVVEDLIKMGQPVVIGDPIEETNLAFTNVKAAKEVFILSNDTKETLVTAEKIRDVNKSCKLYIRLFNDQFRSFLKDPPINAQTFSTSEWAMESVRDWVKNQTGKTLVLGRDNLTQRIVEFIALTQKREVILIDPKIDEDLYRNEPNIKIIKDNCERFRYLRDHVNFEEISQAYVCWAEESEFNTSIYLATQFYKYVPKIKLYIRIFDDELSNVMNKLNAITFSTSEFAFQKLKKIVDSNSSLAD
jgi:Trk K+ transport system NAD-binding subunit